MSKLHTRFCVCVCAFRVVAAPRGVWGLLVSWTNGRHEAGHAVRLAAHHHHWIRSVHSNIHGLVVGWVPPPPPPAVSLVMYSSVGGSKHQLEERTLDSAGDYGRTNLLCQFILALRLHAEYLNGLGETRNVS